MAKQQAKAEVDTEPIVGAGRIATALDATLKLPRLVYEVVGIDGKARKIALPDPREKLINAFNSEYGATGMIARLPLS